jgi:phage shock protein C
MKTFKKGTDRMIYGVCSGFGEYFDIDSTFIRLFFVFLGLILPISMILFYIIADIIMEK